MRLGDKLIQFDTVARLDGDDFFTLPAGLDGLAEPDQTVVDVPESKSADSRAFDEIVEQDDLWLLNGQHTLKQPEFKTWSSFDAPEAPQDDPIFISEVGPAAYDALLAAEENPFAIESNDQYDTLDSKAYINCLLALALGRESLLFTWGKDNGSFVTALPLIKISGYSGDVLRGINRACLESGNANRHLRSFVDSMYAARASPATVAFANALDKILLVIQSELGSRGQSARSLLQLQAIVRPVHAITTYFMKLIVKLTKSTSEENLLSTVFEEAQSAEYGELYLRDTMREVLKMVSKPWTDFVEEWIGLKPEKGIILTKDGPGKSFVKVDNRMWVDDFGLEMEEPDFFLDEEKIPSFVPEDVGQLIFETGRNLRFLRTNHPEHQLSHMELDDTACPRLEWQFDWDDITRIEEKATAYQQAVSEALHLNKVPSKTHSQRLSEFDSIESPQLKFFGKDEFQIESQMLASIVALDAPIQEPAAGHRLAIILSRTLFRTMRLTRTGVTDFTPNWSLLPLLSFGPLISAQSRLINRECLRLLLSTHRLREHLHLMKEFSLFGNGTYCSRLSHALFDSDLEGTERHSGVARSGVGMGLRLSSRDNWPPASSELRLALMGILSDSFVKKQQGQDTGGSASSTRQDSLPGDLSFAVRELSTEEMERCMDPDGLEALDFLRLSYKPPSTLLPVMTPTILLKHDRLFRHLLRMMRMLYVVNQLYRDVCPRSGYSQQSSNASLRFRRESHHFVSNIAAYFFDTGVELPWKHFQSWLDQIEVELKEDDASLSQEHNYSPDRLRNYYEGTLDNIMLSLLLRKRQQPVLKLLEDIFKVILQFAKKARQEDLEQEAADLYRSFRKKVDVFITVCRGLSEKVGYSGKHDGVTPKKVDGYGEEHSLARLLLTLDMSNYYSR